MRGIKAQLLFSVVTSFLNFLATTLYILAGASDGIACGDSGYQR
jgi:hypothetical protein